MSEPVVSSGAVMVMTPPSSSASGLSPEEADIEDKGHQSCLHG
jgi:hypothetical protein